MNKDLVHSINAIFGTYIGKRDLYYNIPAYQRGYKWQAPEVLQLLTDVEQDRAIGSNDYSRFYCLQNITISLNEKEKCFNVIDGQQRLTTLVILLSFLGEGGWLKDKLRFSARPETNEFLGRFILTQTLTEHFTANGLEACWARFIGDAAHGKYDRQDIYFIFSTTFTIYKWFSSSEVDFSGYKDYLLTKVKMIVNNVAKEKEEKIFKNLNSYKVPLDGADLVRAILITRVANEEFKLKSEQQEHVIKQTIQINERRVRIGWELDEINNWWSIEEIDAYFSKFISIDSDMNSTVKFDFEAYPLNNLLALYMERAGKDNLSLHYFEKEEKTKSATQLYKELLQLHHTLKDWYEDLAIYNYMGFLFFQCRVKFPIIWSLWKEEQGRAAFKKALVKLIKQRVFDDEPGFDETKIQLDGNLNWYKEEQPTLVKILLLLDVVDSVKRKHRIPVKGFSKTNNDIEHIFPQNPRDVHDKKAYLGYLQEVARSEEEKQEAQKLIEDFDALREDEDYQERLADFINRQIATIQINSIGNLVLLDSSINRSIKNKPYAEKRGAIVNLTNKGYYIQPHTLKVFVRYFNPQGQDSKELITDLSHWDNRDIENNKKHIETTLNEFFENNK